MRRAGLQSLARRVDERHEAQHHGLFRLVVRAEARAKRGQQGDPFVRRVGTPGGLDEATGGGGIDAPLTVSVDQNGDALGNTHPQTVTLTSKYSDLYNQYPFSNDPNAGLLHPDWWVTECACVPGSQTFPTPFRPMHFYDEQRVPLGRTYQPGAVVRLTVPADTNAAWTVIDLADFQNVAAPMPQPPGSVSVTDFGADRKGVRDSADAFDRAIQSAIVNAGLTVATSANAVSNSAPPVSVHGSVI